MCNDEEDPSFISPDLILKAARDWGTQHGRLLATDLEVREAVCEGREVDWFEHPPMMWEGIGLTEEIKIQAEDVAWCAAQAEGERCSRLPEEEFRELIGEDTYFDGDEAEDDDMCPSV